VKNQGPSRAARLYPRDSEQQEVHSEPIEPRAWLFERERGPAVMWLCLGALARAQGRLRSSQFLFCSVVVWNLKKALVCLYPNFKTNFKKIRRHIRKLMQDVHSAVTVEDFELGVKRDITRKF
jgi:hypothetical protein